MAETAGVSCALYAQQLFEAAYSARCKPTGDRDLDEAVAKMMAAPGDMNDVGNTAQPGQTRRPAPERQAKKAEREEPAPMAETPPNATIKSPAITRRVIIRRASASIPDLGDPPPGRSALDQRRREEGRL